jgi:glycine betaine catabolism A
VSLPTVEWHGLVFVDGSGGAGPLPLAGLDAIVAPYEPERLVVAASRSYDAAVNRLAVTRECE